MDKTASYSGTDSIYGVYLGVDAAGARSRASAAGQAPDSQPSRHPSFLQQAGHLSVAQAVPRSTKRRQTQLSSADTTSVYTTTDTAPYERWSLEQGLEPRADSNLYSIHEEIPPVPAFSQAASASGPNPLLRPDSPSLNRLRNVPSKEKVRLQPDMRPMLASEPVQPTPAPVTKPYASRRHFSRPLRSEDDDHLSPDQQGNWNPTTPIITIGGHRFSASTPDAYGGTAKDSSGHQRQISRSSVYSVQSEDAEPGHLRRRSMPINSAIYEDPEGEEGAQSVRSSMASVRSAIAARVAKGKFGGVSLVDPEVPKPPMAEKPKNDSLAFSSPNAYPFTTSLNGFSNLDQKRAQSPKPASRFSEDEKRGFQTLSENNDLQNSTFNLFGRSPAPPAGWAPGDSRGPTPGAMVAAHANSAQKRQKRRKYAIISAIAILLLAIAGAGTGIGIWRHNVATSTQNNAKVKAADSAAPSSASSSPLVGAAPSGTSSSAAPTKTAVPGSGGPGGYYTIVGFGGSYVDNGHRRDDQYSYTVKPDPYAGGRSTNGPTFEEYLSSMLGPQKSGAPNAMILNYAYSGSFINNSVTWAPAPDLGSQVSSYLGDLNNGNATVTATGVNKTLVTVWAGMEQLITVWQAAQGTNPDSVLETAQAGVDRMLNTMTRSLKWLIPNNAPLTNRPDFALVNLPQGDTLPEIAGLAGYNNDLVSIFKNLTSHYNNGLANVAAALNGTTVWTLKADGLFRSMSSNSSSYNLTNTDKSCLADSCKNPDQYLWYDGLNPTSAVHKIVAKKLAEAVLKG